MATNNKFAPKIGFLSIIAALACAMLLTACGGIDYEEYPNGGYDPAEYADTNYDADPNADDNDIFAFGGTGYAQTSHAVRNENLARLGKVWGFAKYHHDAFISGRLDWDRELLRLVPIVYYASADEVNEILYEWFVGLGDDGFDWEFEYEHEAEYEFDADEFLAELYAIIVMLEGFSDDVIQAGGRHHVIGMHDLHEYLSVMQASGEYLDYSTVMEAFERFLPELAELGAEMMYIDALVTQIAYASPMADLSWINAEFLGAPLAARLQRFDGIRTLDRENAPVNFPHAISMPVFDNQSRHSQANLSDPAYRLLGLFRLWNAMKYYFPHLDVLDVVWNDLLIEFIPRMLDGTCRTSYERTLAAMAHHLHDGHVHFSGMGYFSEIFGRYVVRVRLQAAEGRLVVADSNNWPFIQGDVIVGLNGRDIDEVLAEMLQYTSYPIAENALYFFLKGMFFYHPLRAHERDMEIDVYRDGEIVRLEASGLPTNPRFPWSAPPHHVLLDNNIGLINPRNHTANITHRAMERFADTVGIVIDLRERPAYAAAPVLKQFLLESPQHFASLTSPSTAFPGTRDKQTEYHLFIRDPNVSIYRNPVVILVNELTQSFPEWLIMQLRLADNVTVIGSHTSGANGNATYLPLPGGISMRFTSLGIYTPEGGQTHRIGLAPDIRVTRTIQGIAEGRDEIMEAAIRFILGED